MADIANPNPHRPKHIADALAAKDGPAPAEGREDTNFITLARPIERQGSTITGFRLREPDAGEMRGLTMQDLLTSDISAVITLIPRISNPRIELAEANKLRPVDIAQCGGLIRSFFMSEAEKKAVLEG